MSKMPNIQITRKRSYAVAITSAPQSEFKPARYKLETRDFKSTYSQPSDAGNEDEKLAIVLEKFYTDNNLALPAGGFEISETPKGWVAVEA